MAGVTALSRVEDLVPGDLGAIVTARDMLVAGIAPGQRAAATLTGLQVQGWKGLGADQFAQVASREPEKVAALPAAFSRAVSAMSVWESAFSAARAAAAEAVQLAARADALTAQSQADHRLAMSAAQSAPVASSGLHAPSPVFVDRGAVLNAQAQTTLTNALGTLNAVGAEVAAAIRPMAGWPPTNPDDRNGWDKVAFFASDFFGGILQGVGEQLAGLIEAGWWAFETFDPFRFIINQFNGGDQWSDEWWANFTRRFGEVGESIGFAFTNTGDVLQALIAEFFAVDLWANEPGAAFGRVVLNIALLASGIGALVKSVKGLTILAEAAQAARIEKLELLKSKKLAKLETRARERLDSVEGVDVKDGQVLIDGKPMISVSEWSDRFEASTHNMDADRAGLGAYRHDDPTSYEKLAEESGDFYFSMPSSKTTDMWDETKERFGLTDSQMFDLFNRPFLDEVIHKRLPVRFNENPNTATGTSFIKEWAYLQEKGYILDPKTNIATMEQ